MSKSLQVDLKRDASVEASSREGDLLRLTAVEDELQRRMTWFRCE